MAHTHQGHGSNLKFPHLLCTYICHNACVCLVGAHFLNSLILHITHTHKDAHTGHNLKCPPGDRWVVMEMSSGANTFIIAHPGSWISPFGIQSFLLFYHETIWMQWFTGLSAVFSEEAECVCRHPALWLDSLISGQDNDSLCLHEPMWWSGK